MSFIGVIAESKNEMQIKRILDNNLNSPNKEHTIIVINDKSIENIKNIKFETILVITLDEITNKDIINELFEKTKYLIINTDMKISNLEVINNMKLKVITFGFNQKATITASSVEENPMLCLQRSITNVNENVIEPQEIEVKIINKKLSNSTHNVMAIVSILLIYGKQEIIF